MQKQLKVNYGRELLLADINYKRNITECVTSARYSSVRIQPPPSTPGFQADYSFHRFSWLNPDTSTAK